MTVFAEIIGHTPQKEYLDRVLEKQTMSHAYCFSGPESIGKKLIAERFAGITGGINPDFLVIKRLLDEKTEKLKKNISIEQIRELRERFSMSSIGGAVKVAIIEEADKMTVAAQNALLKTLEEPRGDTLLILLASDVDRLLPTILSRSVHLKFYRIAREKICNYLKEKGTGRDLAHEIAGAAQGRVGVALRMIEDDFYKEQKEKIEEAMGFFNSTLAERFAITEKLAKSKMEQTELEDLISIWRTLLHDLLLASSGAADLIAYSEYRDQITTIGEQKSVYEWMRALKSLNESHTSIKQNGNLNISLEHFALNI